MEKEEYLISIKELAETMGVSQTTVRGWETTKGLSKAKEGTKYKLKLVLRLMYDDSKNKEEELKERTNTSSEEKKYYEAKIKEYEFKELIKELIPKEEYIATEKERFQIIASGIMELPNRIAKSVGLDIEQKKAVRQDCKSLIEQTRETFNGRKKEWEALINDVMKESSNDK